MTLQFVRRHVERSFACVWRALGMRSVSDLRPLHSYTHTHAQLADLHTYAPTAGVPRGTGDEIASFHEVMELPRGKIRSWRIVQTIQRCSLSIFCTRKGWRVVEGMRDARCRCDGRFIQGDALSGWRQRVGRMYTWCGVRGRYKRSWLHGRRRKKEIKMSDRWWSFVMIRVWRNKWRIRILN